MCPELKTQLQLLIFKFSDHLLDNQNSTILPINYWAIWVLYVRDIDTQSLMKTISYTILIFFFLESYIIKVGLRSCSYAKWLH